MRFERLILERYGQFERLDLDLTGDLVIVYGPNEAGKTTLLSAIHALMFGIRQRTAYNFMYDYKAMSIRAELLDRAGRRLQVRRRKRKKQALSGLFEGGGLPPGVIDEAAWQAYFGGLNQDLYQSVFGFTQQHLQQGSEVLRLSGLHEILGGGALGGAGKSVRLLLDSLRQEADSRYLGRGRNPPINRLVTALTEHRRELRDATFDRAQFQQLTQELQTIEEDLARDSGQVEALQKRHVLHQKAVEYCEELRRRDALKLQMQAFSEPPRLDRKAAEQMLQTLDERERLRRRQAELQGQLAALERRQAGLAFDPKLLQVQKTLERLSAQAVSLAPIAQSLTVQAEALQAERERIEQAAPAAPGGHELVAHLAAQVSKLTALVRRTAELRELQGVAERLGREHASAQQSAEQVEAAWEAARSDHSADIIALQAQLEPIAAQLARMGELESELAQLAREQRRELKCVYKFLAEGEAQRLPELGDCPSEAEIAEAQRFEDHNERERRSLMSRFDEANEAHKVARAQLEVLEQVQDLPDPRVLAEARTRRDRTWQQVRRVWERGDSPDLETQAYAPDGDLAAALERAFKHVDATADRICDVALQMARKVELQSAVARHTTEVQLRRARLEKIESDYAQKQLQWQQRWARAGLRAGPPGEMARLRERIVSCHQRVQKRLQLQEELDRRRPAVERFVAAARHTLAAPELARDEVLEQVRVRGREQDRLSGRLHSLQEQRTQVKARVESLAQDHARATLREQQQREGWADEVRALGFDFGQQLPDGHELEALLALAHEAQALLSKRHELAGARRQLEDFYSEVAALAERIGRPKLPGFQQVETLSVAANEAQRVATARSQLADEREDRLAELAVYQQQLAATEERLASWQQRYKASDELDLAKQAEDALQYLQIHQDLQEVQTRLGRGLGGLEAEVEQLLHGADVATLEATALDIGRKLTTIETRRFHAVERRGKLQATYETLGGDKAAARSSLYQQDIAELETQVKQYAVFQLAHRVLADVTEAFVREHQPALLEDTSSIMAGITGGRHVRVEAEEDRDTLVLIDQAGNPRRPDELSTGTREQLFLALRLAYVLEYCGRSEPLPMVMDDVLVNFDNTRAGLTLQALSELSGQTQILFLTCHRHLAEVAHKTCPSAAFVELPQR